MKVVLRTLAIAGIATFMVACALLQPSGHDGDARRAAKVALSAYESTQQAMLIYGKLPPCDQSLALYVCRSQRVWDRLKAADKVATTAIVKAEPVLNGTQVDAGQLLAALVAIDDVRRAIAEAQASIVPAAPAPTTR